MIIDEEIGKIYCDRKEWECYSHTPDYVIEDVNALVYSVITTNCDPVIAQKIIYDTLEARGYGHYGFRDSECDQCTTNILNKYFQSNIDRWANLSLKAEKKNEKWIRNSVPEQVQEQKQRVFSVSSYEKLAEALSDDVANYIRENDKFKELIAELVGDALDELVGDAHNSFSSNLTKELVKKMYLVGMED